MDTEQVRIGKIVGCHGVRGDLKIRPASDAQWVGSLREIILHPAKPSSPKNPAQKVSPQKISTQEEPAAQSYKIRKAWFHGNLVLMHLEGVDTRNDAELLVEATLYARRENLPEPAEDEFWADDVIGLSVIDAETGRKRGEVKDLLSSSGQDYLEIKLEESNETVIIPFLNHFFPEVDVEKGELKIDLLSDFLSMSTAPVTADRLQQ
jgi:16S rRNA processing protein RimM